MTSIPNAQVLKQVQPSPLTNASTGLVDAGNWAVSATWAVPAAATSGLYFARAARDDTGGASLIWFVVRDDENASDLLFQTADTTWQAYNQWGGNSLYLGTAPTPDGRAYKVSYNRPLVLDGISGGYGDYNSPLHAEYPMIRWLESNGYNVSYSTDVDSDRRGAEILEHKVFMSVGHDEYWSGPQRANVEAARDAGVNLAFFSGNEGYWKTRWETSIDGSGTTYRTLVTYKEGRPVQPAGRRRPAGERHERYDLHGRSDLGRPRDQSASARSGWEDAVLAEQHRRDPVRRSGCLSRPVRGRVRDGRGSGQRVSASRPDQHVLHHVFNPE